jgi:hypothetical protein
MALPAAGNSLSLNQIHIEAGGTSGTTCSLNDSDIRGLTPGGGNTIPTGNETTIDIGDFYEASSTNANVHTLVAGFQQTSFIPRSGSGTYTNYYGYMPFYGSPTSQNGSLTPTAFAKKNNDTILAIYKNTSTNNTGIHNKVFLRVDGPQTNAGWTSMNVFVSGVLNVTFYRTAAQQFVSGSNYSYWKWAYTGSIFSNNVSHIITFA